MFSKPYRSLIKASFTFEAGDAGCKIWSSEINGEESLVENWTGHVSGSFTERGLVMRSNSENFELLF